jgi:ribosomal-protein-alanine N-acetyltransferase
MSDLTTQKLRLVPCSVEMFKSLIDENIDLAKLIDAHIPDSWPAEELREVAVYYIKLLSESPNVKDRLCWFIVEKEQNIVIGSIGFKAKPDKDGVVEIGFGIEPAFRLQGYATDAVEGVIKWALSQNDIRKVIAECEPNNKPSVRVLEKVGMKRTRLEGNMIKWEIERDNEKILSRKNNQG